ncbi:hypothetical protein MLD38_004798 [Melastoma candidum]|uniref:Uncharacterized protein n=1 Tax=Melastoma candidum TaxID=119954 RepID=A0ACB9S8S1_9MYRT|nr:hypothetical protein MLD38_004798 [Melastoma candidum]
MATSSFCVAVEQGLLLSRRLYYGKGEPPSPVPPMSKSPDGYLPTSVTAYAEVYDPSAVDNPDVASYQPYIHGRCDPPALIPLQMMDVRMEAFCWLDTAFVTLAGVWRLHCVKSSRHCDCRVAVPMGEQGLLLGVEVSVAERSYCSQLIAKGEMEGITDTEAAKARDGWFLKFQTFVFRIPEVEGGSTLSIKVNWSQKLEYREHQYCLSIPFSFPPYVNPRTKQKNEMVILSVSSGTSAGILFGHSSHPLKEVHRDAGKVDFAYKGDNSAWSTEDFTFSFSVSSADMCCGLLLQAPPPMDVDQREMFCLYLCPGNNQRRTVFRREVIFIVDISGSMQGDLVINTKIALLECLAKLGQGDSFNVIAFNDNAHLLSSSMRPATKDEISSASEWINETFMPSGGTNILLPVELALKLVAETTDSIPSIILITDGSVDNERQICCKIKDQTRQDKSICPRVSTLAIGAYCNHYFLQMLAQIGRGHFDAATDAESILHRLPKLFDRATSIILAGISVDALQALDSVEMHPFLLPDLSSDHPLIALGRYSGKFPEFAEVTGTVADGSVHSLDLKVGRAEDVPMDKILAWTQIDSLTAHAWADDDIDAQHKVAQMSIQSGVPSEFTGMILLETNSTKQPKSKLNALKKLSSSRKPMELNGQKIVFLGILGKGFGDLIATANNIPPGTEEKQYDATQLLVKAASAYYSKFLDRFCCMCFLRTCSRVNDQCAILASQFCAALACCECIDCCFDLCDCLSSCLGS